LTSRTRHAILKSLNQKEALVIPKKPQKASAKYTPDERETVVILNDLGEITISSGSEWMRAVLRRWLGKPTSTAGQTDLWEGLSDTDYEVKLVKRIRPPSLPPRLARERVTFVEKRDGVPSQTT
jgi:hypothetical protein